MIPDRNLLKFRDFIYESMGLWFGDSKLPVLASRLKMRFAKLGITNPDDYLKLVTSESDRAEIETLISLITTNETYFYRAESQMDSFRELVLPRVIEKKITENDRRLKIWSAGCSSGEEPYTIAICIQETLPFHSIWDINILATDLSTEMLAKGLEGEYAKRSVDHMPPHLLKKYFFERNGHYHITNVIKKVVDFEYSNLVDAYFDTDYDIIFCRNVLIYFRDETKSEILKKFHGALKDGGYLFLGPTEMVRGLVDGFKMLSLKDSVAFQKIAR